MSGVSFLWLSYGSQFLQMLSRHTLILSQDPKPLFRDQVYI